MLIFLQKMLEIRQKRKVQFFLLYIQKLNVETCKNVQSLKIDANKKLTRSIVSTFFLLFYFYSSNDLKHSQLFPFFFFEGNKLIFS
jgi:hypothetical protein